MPIKVSQTLLAIHLCTHRTFTGGSQSLQSSMFADIYALIQNFNSDTTSTICAFKLSQTKRSQHHILLAHAEHHLAACHTLHMQSKMYSPTVYCILYIGRIPCTKLIHQHQLVCSRRRSENEADPHSLLSIMARCGTKAPVFYSCRFFTEYSQPHSLCVQTILL